MSFPLAARRLLAVAASLGVLAIAIGQAVAMPLAGGGSSVGQVGPMTSPGHLLISEVMTGGSSASDEFIELYNPSAGALPLEGLEVVYVTVSGATVTRKAAWAAGAPEVGPGAHLLVANAAGVFAPLADASYANGLAATGGSVALRLQGAATAIDAVGWGAATSTWLETRPAAAPAAGSSLERLPGGSSGSGQDTDDNLVDFTIQPVPDPQNSGSPPTPSASASPMPSATDAATPSPTPEASLGSSPDATLEPTATETPLATPTFQASGSPVPTETPAATATPGPSLAPTPVETPMPPIPIGTARSQPDGTVATVEGVALTASDFTDGGGYVLDATAGIAVLLADGTFSRGSMLRVTGTLDDRYAQRTIRSSAAQVSVLGAGIGPLPVDAATGAIGEGLEGALVELTGVIVSSATTLSAGVAWDLDDGSGPTRVLVATSTGIDTSAWARGVGLTLIGVVGQRDSSGGGTGGYRVQPRDAADVVAFEPVATPSPSATPQPTASPTPTLPSATPLPSASPTPTPEIPLLSIEAARAATVGTHLRVRGVVTAQSGLIEVGSAVVQDPTGAILVRLAGDAGSLGLGQLVELSGTRSTKAGMLSLRVTTPPLSLGRQADPEPLRRATGALDEGEEALLVVARGAVRGAISRPRNGAVSFAIDDGSGPIRVTISARAGIAAGAIQGGTWLELRGVLGQETTGDAPLRGYRLWPRAAGDLTVIASPVVGFSVADGCCASIEEGIGHPMAGGPLPEAASTGATRGLPGTTPVVARPDPTGSPRSAAGDSPAQDAARPPVQRLAGLAVSGMGVLALGSLAAWYGWRRRDSGDRLAGPPGAESQTPAPPTAPRRSAVRAEATGTHEERRILPPT
jgi:hypothetical protein